MSKQSRRNFLKLAGAAVATTFAGSALADESPFGLKTMASGYQQVAEDDTKQKAQQGNCGAAMQKEGNCGASMKPVQQKVPEGNCGAAMQKEGNCGASMKPVQQKAPEGKCGGKQ